MNSSENKQKNQKGALYHPFTCYECDRWLVSCIFNTLPHLSPHAPEAPKMATLPMDLSLPVQESAWLSAYCILSNVLSAFSAHIPGVRSLVAALFEAFCLVGFGDFF